MNYFSLLRMLSVVSVLCTIVFIAFTNSIYIPTFHLDGAYQTASSLFRILHGEFPGKDFFPYLGSGIVYFIFPWFFIFGANVAASVFVTYLIVPISVGIGVGVMVWLTWIGNRSSRFNAACMAGVIFIVCGFSPLQILPSWMLDSFWPGTSLRSFRPFLLIIDVVILSWILARLTSPRQDFAIALLAAANFLWSNDYAYVGALFVLSVFFLEHIRTRSLTLQIIGRVILTFPIFVFLLFFVATDGYPLRLLEYNFFGVASSQWWYYEPYGSEAKIFNFSDLSKVIFLAVQPYGSVFLGFFMIGFYLVRWVWRGRREDILQAALGGGLFGGGLVPSIGGHVGMGYFIPFIIWGIIGSMMAIIQFILPMANAIFPTFTKSLGYMVACFITVLSMSSSVINMKKASEAYNSARYDPNLYYNDYLGGFVPKDYQPYLEWAKNHEHIVEEYWGLASAVSKEHFYQVPVDSVIHAFGSARRIFEDVFKHSPAGWMITTKPGFNQWQEWSLIQNWWFYREVLNNYEPFLASPSTVAWKYRGEKNIFGVPSECSVVIADNRELSLAFEGLRSKFYELLLNYKVDGSRRSLILAWTNVGTPQRSGVASLDPSATSARFPARAVVDGQNIIPVQFATKQEATFTIQSCSVRGIEVSPAAHEAAFGPLVDVPVDITDSNWFRGVSRSRAEFLLKDSANARVMISSGSTIAFSDGTERKIISTEIHAEWFHVLLTGAVLDPIAHGYPHRFSITPDILVPFNLTDKNWINGISRNNSVFFVLDTPAARNAYVPNTSLEFVDGTRVKVIKIEPAGSYLHIYFDGTPLDGISVGYPNSVKIVR